MALWCLLLCLPSLQRRCCGDGDGRRAKTAIALIALAGMDYACRNLLLCNCFVHGDTVRCVLALPWSRLGVGEIAT